MDLTKRVLFAEVSLGKDKNAKWSEGREAHLKAAGEDTVGRRHRQ